MRISRLIDKGILFINGNMVSSNWEAEHKNTKTRTNGLCDDVRDVCDVREDDAQTCVCAGNSDNDDCPF